MYRLLRIGLGIAFLILGFIGLFLPFLQGILFLGIGGMLLYRDLSFLQKLTKWLKARYPWIDRIIDRAGKRIRAFLPRRAKDRRAEESRLINEPTRQEAEAQGRDPGRKYHK